MILTISDEGWAIVRNIGHCNSKMVVVDFSPLNCSLLAHKPRNTAGTLLFAQVCLAMLIFQFFFLVMTAESTQRIRQVLHCVLQHALHYVGTHHHHFPLLRWRSGLLLGLENLDYFKFLKHSDEDFLVRSCMTQFHSTCYVWHQYYI